MEVEPAPLGASERDDSAARTGGGYRGERGASAEYGAACQAAHRSCPSIETHGLPITWTSERSMTTLPPGPSSLIPVSVTESE